MSRYIDSLSTVLLYFLIEYYFVCFRRYVWTTVLFETKWLSTKRPFFNYVDQVLPIIDYLPTPGWHWQRNFFIVMIENIYFGHISTLLVNVVKERSLTESWFIYLNRSSSWHQDYFSFGYRRFCPNQLMISESKMCTTCKIYHPKTAELH